MTMKMKIGDPRALTAHQSLAINIQCIQEKTTRRANFDLQQSVSPFFQN